PRRHSERGPRLLQFFSLLRSRPPRIYTLSLHDALPISGSQCNPTWCQILGISKPKWGSFAKRGIPDSVCSPETTHELEPIPSPLDRKSTRLNSSHVSISYAVFCLKKKTRIRARTRTLTT